MSIEDVVNVAITTQTQPVLKVGFGIGIVVGAHKAFAERVRYYNSLKAVGVDFDSDAPEYRAAQSYFAQNPAPISLGIGRRDCASVSVQVTEALPNRVYSLVLNGVAYSYTTPGTSPTISQVVTNLIAAVNAATATHGVNAIADTTDSTKITLQSTSTASYSLAASDKIVINQTFAPTSDIIDDLKAVQQEDDSWYAMMITSRDEADILKVADWIEAQRKMFGTCSSAPAIRTVAASLDTTSLAAKLKAKGLARTFLMWHADPSEFPEAAYFGRNLPQVPGSITWILKTLNSITVDAFTQTQENNLRAKNVNFYQSMGGANVVRDGKMCGGEFIDITHGVDKLQSDITYSLYSLMVNQGKIPYSDAGIVSIENEIRKVVKQAINDGFLLDDPAPVYIVPKRADTSFNDRALRQLNGVKFQANLAGAIHMVTVMGTVTV